MKKYYFDRVSEQRSEYDFVGTALPTADRAVQVAELIAIELGMDGEGTWHGWAIAVRNAQGEQFSRIPVQETELAAA
jgi:hypothetical protein